MEKSTKKIVLCALLTALAVVLGWVEAQIPIFAAVPGMKAGLTNIVVLFALYCIDIKSAAFINLIRIVLVSFLFGNMVSLVYSLAGGILSFIVMVLLIKTGKLHIVTVSIAGAVCHNIGQILTAMVMLCTYNLVWYLMILWFTGIAAGAVVGIIGGVLCKRLKNAIQ